MGESFDSGTGVSMSNLICTILLRTVLNTTIFSDMTNNTIVAMCSEGIYFFTLGIDVG